MVIDLAEDFSPYPSGREPKDGDNNGARFRDKILIPAIKKILSEDNRNSELIIDIDGVKSFGSSFLEEAFGGLARAGLDDLHEAVNTIRIRCKKSHLRIYQDSIVVLLKDMAPIDEKKVRIN